MYTDQIDWKKVNSKYHALVKGKNTTEEKKEAYQFLINSLKDKHANVRSAEDNSIVVSYTGETKNPDTRTFDADFLKNSVNNPNGKFSYQLKDDVGILKVVGIGPGDVKTQSDEIRAGLVELKKQGVKKWIVDLRSNGGGNIDPMISGLAPLIGEGKIGGSVNLKSETMIEFTIEDSQFFHYGRLVCGMKDEPQIDLDEKVVVLLSRYTISSGEMLAIAFKGRPNTHFIGEDSGGLTTGNGYDLIEEDGVYLVISQGVFSDRFDKPYLNKVKVDEHIPFDVSANMESDKQIKRAMEWLKK